MYCPPAFREEELSTLHGWMLAARLANLVTMGEAGIHASPLPLFLDAQEGPYGTLYGHLARANPQWQDAPTCEGLAIFMGPDAYVTPSWYASKQAHGKVVPTWNYTTVQARGPVEFFEDEARLHNVVDRLTRHHEAGRAEEWGVSDAPEKFIKGQLRGIIGLRMPIRIIEGKHKMSQNRSVEDRAGVAKGLSQSDLPGERALANAIMADGA
ncbi:FMN-binding negative transcriptional regulator [Nitratireductor basaltis]|nr:FMN-binding negative transcriptional regulator [Nitratireductor basaltis]